jgi:hypothetical protein
MSTSTTRQNWQHVRHTAVSGDSPHAILVTCRLNGGEGDSFLDMLELFLRHVANSFGTYIFDGYTGSYTFYNNSGGRCLQVEFRLNTCLNLELSDERSDQFEATCRDIARIALQAAVEAITPRGIVVVPVDLVAARTPGA